MLTYDLKDLVKSITIDCNPQICTSMGGTESDPDWHLIDAQGHHHWCSKKEENHYPTLIEVTEPGSEYIDEDGEEYGPVTHLECAVCGEIIEPGRKETGVVHTYIAGPFVGKLEYYTLLHGAPAIGTAHISPDQLSDLNFHANNPYDYGHERARAIIQYIIQNQTMGVRTI